MVVIRNNIGNFEPFIRNRVLNCSGKHRSHSRQNRRRRGRESTPHPPSARLAASGLSVVATQSPSLSIFQFGLPVVREVTKEEQSRRLQALRYEELQQQHLQQQQQQQQQQQEKQVWRCSHCTLDNEIDAPSCRICDTSRNHNDILIMSS